MRKLFLTPLAIFVFAMTLAPLSAKAEGPRLIGQYSDWAAYVVTENGNKVCYMVSQPSKAQGDYTRRGEVFALLTHRPAEGTKNVFSYITGYAYKPGSDATLSFGNVKFTLFTQDETAWAPDAETDNSIAKSLRTGSSMTVKGTSSRGTSTSDSFSLRGSGAAHDAISEECGTGRL
jgi:invasion protein IalB